MERIPPKFLWMFVAKGLTMLSSLCLYWVMADQFGSQLFGVFALGLLYANLFEYVFPEGKIFHFDFFRIKNESEAFDLGFEEYLTSDDYCFIEWPEMIPNLWPDNFLEIKITETEGGMRKIFAQKHSKS